MLERIPVNQEVVVLSNFSKPNKILKIILKSNIKSLNNSIKVENLAESEPDTHIPFMIMIIALASWSAIPAARLSSNPLSTVKTKRQVTRTEIAILAYTTLFVLFDNSTIYFL